MDQHRLPRLLIVEDDEGIGPSLVRATQANGFAPRWCRSAAEVRRVALRDFDVVLLDLGLPDADGLDLCRRLRRGLPTTPILILTARDTEADIVLGLDAGADDHLVKPFRLAELLARLRAHARRHAAEAQRTGLLQVGDLELDPAARRVRVDGAEVELRPKEFDLLEVLMQRAGKVVPRDRVMSLVWGDDWFGSTKTLDVHMASLRQRLGEDGADGSRVTTIRGVGYRLELPGED